MNTAIYLCDSIQWDKWTALGTMFLAVLTFALAIAAFLAIYYQREQFRKQREDDNERAFKNSSVILITDFDKQFNDLVEDRIKVAKIIIKHKILENDSFDYKILDKKMDEIYDFFDTLGYFVDQEYIKVELAHQYFHHWFSMYYEFYKLYKINELAGYEKTVWNNMPKLSLKMDKVEAEQHGKGQKKISKDNLKGFFEDEALEDI